MIRRRERACRRGGADYRGRGQREAAQERAPAIKKTEQQTTDRVKTDEVATQERAPAVEAKQTAKVKSDEEETAQVRATAVEAGRETAQKRAPVIEAEQQTTDRVKTDEVAAKSERPKSRRG